MNIDDKISKIREFAEEIVSEDELRKLFESKKHLVAYDGFEPSGKMHIAQGLMRVITMNKMISTGCKFKIYVADWFGMLNNKMDGDLEKIRDVGNYFVEIWKAVGLDMKNVEIVWASDFIKKNPNYWETVLRLSTKASIQRVMRCGQIMGRKEGIENPSAQIIYPLMQAADIHHLGADIAQLGVDQRKVNVLARELFPKIGLKAPVIISHRMLPGLQYDASKVNNKDDEIDMKMSKSNPDSAVFMNDSTEEIKRKIKKSFCPEKIIEGNPVLAYLKEIIFEMFDEVEVKRPDKFGGNKTYKKFDELEKDFKKGDLHPVDAKALLADYLDKAIEPVRKHFEKNSKAKALLKKVESYRITR